MSDNIQEMTPCQISGHRFYASDTFPVLRCQDCDESYADEESYNASNIPEVLDVLWPGVSGDCLAVHARKCVEAARRGEASPERVFVITNKELLLDALAHPDFAVSLPPAGFMKWLKKQNEISTSAAS